ncbi:MAG: hypothetical protein WCO66_03850, partial [Candidatus Absconditabacteria bacterium]
PISTGNQVIIPISTGNQIIISTHSGTKIAIHTNNKVNYGEGNSCGWTDAQGKPNSTYFKAAKLVNLKLEELWNKGTSYTPQYINDANDKLGTSSLSNSDKCTYSWLIDTLQSQKGYLRYYSIETGVTKIGIDFVSYIETLNEIDLGGAAPSFTKNASTKTKEYLLSSDVQLQTLGIDTNGNVLSGEKYLTGFNDWLSQFCNGESIYNGERNIDTNGTDIGIMDWNKNNFYCVKNTIKNNSTMQYPIYDPISFSFNGWGEVQKIDLNWWNLKNN